MTYLDPALNRNADAALKIARERGLTISRQVNGVEAVLAAVDAAMSTPDPEMPALPTRAAEIPTVLAEYGARFAEAGRTRLHADQWRAEAVARFARAVADDVPAWVDALSTAFNAALGDLRAAASNVPADIVSREMASLTVDDFKHFQSATTAIRALEAIVRDRVTFGAAVGEPGARDRFLLAAILRPPTRGDVVFGSQPWRDLIDDFTKGNAPIPRWLHVVRENDITLKLAKLGEVANRAAILESWRDYSSSAMFGGGPTRDQVIADATRTYKTLV